MPAPPLNLLRRRVEYVQDVGCLSVTDFDAERVDQAEPVEPVATLDGQLGREPAAEREAHQRRLLVRQRVEKIQVEVDEVVDRLEVRRARGSPEAGVRGGDDLGMTAEHFQKWGSRIDGLRAMQEQHRPAGAAAQYFQVDSPDEVAR